MRLAPLRRSSIAGALLLVALVGCITVDLGGRDGELVETVVYGESGPKILLVDIDGVITAEPREGALGFGSRESVVARLREQLDRAREEEVRALLLRIDSPGGTVTASEVVYREILRLKEETGVPVVACFMGTATSGAYYAAMAADTIVAHPTSVTGSIGVLFASVSLSGLMEKVGVENQTLTTGVFKDAGSPLRRMSPEERAQLQSVIDDLYARFVAVVTAGRPGLSADEVAALADGRIYSAPQALEGGLIDSIDDLPAAVQEAERRAGLEESQVVVYHRSREHRGSLYAAAPSPEPVAFDPGRWLGVLREPAFLYLWWPGGRF